MSNPAKAHPNPLASSRVLVIGGTSGLGLGAAAGALANGAAVHISSSNPDKVAAKVAELKALYPAATVSGTAADLSDESALEATVETLLTAAVAALGGEPLDHIVHTAGEATSLTPLAERAIDLSFYKPWTVRFLAPVAVAKLLLARPGIFIRSDAASSSLTLTGAILAHRPRPGLSGLLPLLGALDTLTRCLAVDLAPVRVNLVSPGAVRTERLEGLGEQAIKDFGAKTLVGAVGSVDQLAEAYLFSMRSAFTTGQEITVDGGSLLL